MPDLAYKRRTPGTCVAARSQVKKARLGQTVDILIRDPGEADTEEWWVVGEPPAKQRELTRR